jgi:type III secretion system low calcium response chaperone LcrH/SycD
MKAEKQQVKNAAEAVGKGMGESLTDNLAEAMMETMKSGKIPREALGFSNERMETIYGQAYRLYNTGKFAEAMQLFRVLLIAEPTDPKYYLGMAACFHMMKDYTNAARLYMICSVVDATSPIPCFHAADCYIQLRERASAIMSLEMGIKRAGDRPEYQVLKERSLLMIENLKKELSQQNEGIKIQETS